MEERRLEKQQASPWPGGRSTDAADSLPSEVVRDASRRLGWAGLVYSLTYFFAYFGVHFVGVGTHALPAHRMLLERPVPTVVAVASLALGVAVFWLSRRSRLAAPRLLDLGLVFEVLGALGIAVAEFWDSQLRVGTDLFVGLSWTCVWIVVFPVTAPSTPAKTATAAVAAASMGPLALALSAAAGGQPPGLGAGTIAVYFLFSTYLCAALAYVTARIIYRFGVRLREALEVGSYRLVERIESGGMGEVWRAEHRLLAWPAAVKVIRPELTGRPTGDDGLKRRFEREARATSMLRSVHTVQLYDYGVTDDGLFYYVMELLDGLSFERLVKRFGPLPPGRVIHLGRQACHSLGEAHERGLIHRDVKPANLVACRLGPDHDFVKVLDFGIVKVAHDLESRDPELTARGEVTGTPAFMTPELALGQGPVDGRADLYALGCVAYWHLTGSRVFEAASAMAVVVEHARATPVRPSERSETPIPGDLEAIVLRCLEKRPQDRPASAWELDAALATCAAAGEWGEREAEAWWRVHVPDRGSPDPLTRPGG